MSSMMFYACFDAIVSSPLRISHDVSQICISTWLPAVQIVGVVATSVLTLSILAFLPLLIIQKTPRRRSVSDLLTCVSQSYCRSPQLLPSRRCHCRWNRGALACELNSKAFFLQAIGLTILKDNGWNFCTDKRTVSEVVPRMVR